MRTPDALAAAIAADIHPFIVSVLRITARGGDPTNMAESIASTVWAAAVSLRKEVIISPYDDVHDDDWERAHEDAAQRIYEREGEEREPTHEEIEAQLERNQDWRKAI